MCLSHPEQGCLYAHVKEEEEEDKVAMLLLVIGDFLPPLLNRRNTAGKIWGVLLAFQV